VGGFAFSSAAWRLEARDKWIVSSQNYFDTFSKNIISEEQAQG
jgi:hypothetical protein